MMPFSIGSLPFDILFFGCGCAAKRNKWLDQLPLQGWGGRLLYPLAVLLGAVLSTGIVVLWVEGLFEGAGPDFSTYPLWAEIGFPALLILFGVACTVFSLAAVQLFKSHFNVTGPRWKFLSQAAYGVYLIHPLVVVPLVGAYIALLRSRGEHIEFPPGSTISSSHLS